jgi:hypothetical protein
MFFVYSSTYTTANLTQYYCKQNEIDYKTPTLITTSLVNMLSIGYKDKEFSKIFKNVLHKMPLSSYMLFGLRDILTISSSFIFKQDFTHYLHNYIPYNSADFISSLTLPITCQIISTPLHILAIDKYQHPTNTWRERIRNIKDSYKSVCSGRIIRVIPAFCIGGFINDMLRERK